MRRAYLGLIVDAQTIGLIVGLTIGRRGIASSLLDDDLDVSFAQQRSFPSTNMWNSRILRLTSLNLSASTPRAKKNFQLWQATTRSHASRSVWISLSNCCAISGSSSRRPGSIVLISCRHCARLSHSSLCWRAVTAAPKIRKMSPWAYLHSSRMILPAFSFAENQRACPRELGNDGAGDSFDSSRASTIPDFRRPEATVDGRLGSRDNLNKEDPYPLSTCLFISFALSRTPCFSPNEDFPWLQ